MRFSTVLVGIMLLGMAMISCKKDDAQPAFTIEGKWSGKHGDPVPNSYYGLNFKPNGVLERIGASGSVGATGTWQFSNNVVTGTYLFDNGTKVSLKATYDPGSKKLNGTYGYGTSTSGEAVFYLQKVSQ